MKVLKLFSLQKVLKRKEQEKNVLEDKIRVKKDADEGPYKKIKMQ